MKNVEFKEQQEQREKTSKIILEIFRHGKIKRIPGVADLDVVLTPEGREGARDRGKEFNPQREVSLSWSSPARRTQESALLAMLANESEIESMMSVEEIEQKIAEQLKKGQKLRLQDDLYFSLDGPMQWELRGAMKAGNTMQYLIEKSDQRAVELKDTQSATYSRAAGVIAENIGRYLRVGQNFNRLVEGGKYEEFGNQLERYISTHQNIVESFIAKALDKSAGREKRDEYLKEIGGGMAEMRGMRVEIINTGADQKIKIFYGQGEKEAELELDKNIIEEIVKERIDLEKTIKESK